MPETATKLERPEAIAIAKRFVSLIEDACSQLIVAGSLRRRLAFVHDIEIVATPRTSSTAVDLLGGTLVAHDLLAERMAELLEAGTVSKRLDKNGTPRWGPAARLLHFDGARIDLFSPAEPERYGWILLVRTGPAAYSRQLVMPRGRQTRDQRPGLLPPHILPRDGWLTERVSGYRVPTPTEQDACSVLGISYRDPWERT